MVCFASCNPRYAFPSFYAIYYRLVSHLLVSQAHVPETNLQLRGPDENPDQLLQSTRRYPLRMAFQQFCSKLELAKSRNLCVYSSSHTRSESHSFGIVLGDIVFDPLPVLVPFTESPGIRIESLGDSTVPDETRCQCHL